MRKFILALVLVMFVAVLGAVPAQAAPVATSDAVSQVQISTPKVTKKRVRSARVGCTGYEMSVGYNMSNLSGSIRYDFDGFVRYDHCGQFDEIIYSRYRAERIRGDCRDWGDAGVDVFRTNWGDFGSYNIAGKEFNCPMSGDLVIKYTYPPDGDYTIWHGNDDRCAKLSVKVVLIRQTDTTRFTPAMCLT